MSGRKHEAVRLKVLAVLIPFLLSMIYFLANIIFSFLLDLSHSGNKNVIVTSVCDVVFLILYGWLYHRVFYKNLGMKKPGFYKFSSLGILVLFFSFVCVFLFSQLMGFWVSENLPSSGMHAYADLKGVYLRLYVIMAITVAPIFEELLFRGFLYRFMRLKWGKPVSFFVSCFLFTIIHGTTEHVPVTLFVSLFSCILVEITDGVLYSIVFHVLYNLCAVVYVTSIPITGVSILVGFGVVLGFLIFGLCLSDPLKAWLAPGGTTPIVDILDEKRKDMGIHKK